MVYHLSQVLSSRTVQRVHGHSHSDSTSTHSHNTSAQYYLRMYVCMQAVKVLLSLMLTHVELLQIIVLSLSVCLLSNTHLCSSWPRGSFCRHCPVPRAARSLPCNAEKIVQLAYNVPNKGLVSGTQTRDRSGYPRLTKASLTESGGPPWFHGT